jgi:biotin carboxylase
MLEKIKAADLATPRQILTNNITDILIWLKDLKTFPVVLKPPKSCATDLVMICNNEEEVKDAFNKIYGATNFTGIKNDYVLAQSYLVGTEYVVNGVSYDGNHYLSEMWEYSKIISPEEHPIYDSVKLLPYNFIYRDVLKNYTYRVLDALQINYGAYHAEIILTNTGPVLVEVAARIMGAPIELISLAINRNQLDMMLDSYIDPKNFAKNYNEEWTIKKHVVVKYLIARASGKLKALANLETIKNLPSFHSINMNIAIGSIVLPTKNLFAAPGVIFLIHENEDVIKEDYKKLCGLEKTILVLDQ